MVAWGLSATLHPDDMRRPELVIYSRRECHLCDVAMEAVDALRGRLDFGVEVRDVDEQDAWREAYGEQVPVGFVDGRKVFKYRVDATALERALRAPR